MKIRIIVIFLLAVAVSALADEPFIGTLRSTMGNPIKGAKVYVQNKKNAIKSDKKGEFRFNDVNPNDTIHIDYKGKTHSFAVNGRQDMMLVVGEDNHIFERDNYTGEAFHGHLIDYKSKPIRGAIIYASDPFDYVKSDADGNFLIDNIEPTDTIHIKYDGYIHDIAMDGSKGMYIKILRATGRRADVNLVNTGAGMVDSRYYAGPISERTAKELEATGASSLAWAMVGMRGVNVFQPRKAGEPPIVSTRTGGAPPLWIVDGVQMIDAPEIPTIDVEKVQVLLDGGMFGVRGYGGVIIVTTKGSNL